MLGDFSLYMRRSLSVMAATIPAMSDLIKPELHWQNELSIDTDANNWVGRWPFAPVLASSQTLRPATRQPVTE
jgi:hypothetical protein